MNSTCTTVGGTPSGGSISAPSTSCPVGSTLEYSTDGGLSWSTTLPVYAQTGPAQTIDTRCNCDSDNSVSSTSSSVVTVPGTCPLCPDLSVAPSNVTITSESTCGTGCAILSGSITDAALPCPTGSTMQYSLDAGMTWSTSLPVYDDATPLTIITRCNCDLNSDINSPASLPISTTPGQCTTPTFSISSISPTMCGANDAILTLFDLMPNENYIVNYSLNGDPQTPVSLSSDATGSTQMMGLSEGSYDIIITNSFGCNSTMTNHILTNTSAPTISIDYSNPTCSGSNNGSILVTASGTGCPNSTLSYVWNHDLTNTTNSAMDLAPGTYLMTVSESCDDGVSITQCSATVSVELMDPMPLVISTTDLTKCAGEDLVLIANATGGTGLLSFEWTGPGISGMMNGDTIILSSVASSDAGTYTVVVSDSNNCSEEAISNVEVLNCTALYIDVTNPCFCLNNAVDNLGTDGQIGSNYEIGGGSGSYLISIIPETAGDIIYENDATNTELSDIDGDPTNGYQFNAIGSTFVEDLKFYAGSSYTIVVSDGVNTTSAGPFGLGCAYPQLTLPTNYSTCEGGSVTLVPNAISGISNTDLIYTWSTAESTDSITVIAGTLGSTSNYYLEVQNAEGCMVSTSTDISSDCQFASVGGTNGLVYNDVNLDGTFTPGTDTLLSGATVTLTNAGDDGIYGTTDDLTYTTTTNSNGEYEFLNVVPGEYQVAVEIAGYDPTIPVLGMTTITLANGENLSPTFAFNPTVVVSLHLISFILQEDCNNMKLNWSMVNEVSIKEYWIQRSTDGINFETISQIASGTALYQYIDKAPHYGINYYRIVSISTSEAKEHSLIIAGMNNCNNEFELVNVYPNPTENYLFYTIHASTNSEVEIVLMNELGQTQLTKKINLNIGENVIKMDVSALSKSLYLTGMKTPEGEYKNLRKIAIVH